MTRTKRLLTAAGVGAVLIAGMPSAVSAMTSPSTQTTTTTSTPARGENGNGRAVDRQCAYPPSRTSNLALSASANSTVRGGRVSLLGQMAANGCPVKQGEVTLYSSTSANGPFTSTGLTTVTDNTGNFAFNVTPTVTTYYRVAYTGSPGLDGTVSNVIRITVTTKK